MSDFKEIKTQEEFNAAIGERLKREREAVKKEFEGYLSPEDAAKKYAGYLSPEDETKKYAGYLSPEEAAKKDEEEKARQKAEETNFVVQKRKLCYTFKKGV